MPASAGSKRKSSPKYEHDQDSEGEYDHDAWVREQLREQKRASISGPSLLSSSSSSSSSSSAGVFPMLPMHELKDPDFEEDDPHTMEMDLHTTDTGVTHLAAIIAPILAGASDAVVHAREVAMASGADPREVCFPTEVGIPRS